MSDAEGLAGSPPPALGLNQALEGLARRIAALEALVAEVDPAHGMDGLARRIHALEAKPEPAVSVAALEEAVSMVVQLLAPRGLHRCVNGVMTWPKSECYACGVPDKGVGP